MRPAPPSTSPGPADELEAAGLRTFELAYGEVISDITGDAMSRTRREAA
jgi:hypothetical protein